MMIRFLFFAILVGFSSCRVLILESPTAFRAANLEPVPPPQPAPVQPPPVAQRVDWGRCVKIAPKEQEKVARAQIIDECIKSSPLKENFTDDDIQLHRNQVARCALNKENWFDTDGKYRYDKAETEIRGKALPTDIEEKILKQHGDCRQEAVNQFKDESRDLREIQLYQACMDYHIAQICEIKYLNP